MVQRLARSDKQTDSLFLYYKDKNHGLNVAVLLLDKIVFVTFRQLLNAQNITFYNFLNMLCNKSYLFTRYMKWEGEELRVLMYKLAVLAVYYSLGYA